MNRDKYDKARARLLQLTTNRRQARRADLVSIIDRIELDAYLLSLFVGEEYGQRGIGAIEVGAAHARRELKRKRPLAGSPQVERSPGPATDTPSGPEKTS